jgi:nicotinic acid mononucleotide adenylyltransferase
MELKDITPCVSKTTTITSTAPVLSSVKTLLEAEDISILPQHRLKVPQTNLIPAVCFYNGTFVPIHAGHVSVLQEAKQYIDHLGTHELLAAYISPSHSGYAAKKLRPEELIGAGHRLTMIHLATENLDWVMVDLFEIFQPCNTSLNVIMEAFIWRVHSQLANGARIDIFWLKGEDSLFHRKSPDKYIRLGIQTLYVLNRECNDNTNNTKDELTSVQQYYKKR